MKGLYSIWRRDSAKVSSGLGCILCRDTQGGGVAVGRVGGRTRGE